MAIVVRDPGNVMVDGKAYGSIVDVAFNFRVDKGDPAELDAAIQAWHQGLLDSHKAEVDEQAARHTKELNVITESAQGQIEAKHSECEAALADARATHQVAIEQLAFEHAAQIKALETTYAETLAAKDAERQSALSQQAAIHKAAIEEREAKRAKAAEAGRARVKELEAKIAEYAELIEALGGTGLGQEMRRKARCKALHEQMASIKAELAEVDGGGA